MKATFPMRTHRYGRTVCQYNLELGTTKGAVTIPSQSVLAGQNGEYVWS
jgi:hypothetical protein